MRAIEVLRVVLGLDLSPADKLTLMAIIHSINWETWRGQVSIKQLSGMSRVSSASTKRALASLTEKQLISRERHTTRYGEASAVTIVNIENINDFAVAHSEPTLAHGDTSMAHSEPPLSVLSVSPSVSPVDQSVDQSVESSVVLAQPPSETPRAETAEAPRWRTIPRQQRFAHQALYFSILEGLGYDFDETVHLRVVLQNNLIFPDQVDIQAFLTHYEH